ncbi:caffeine-induced death protein 2 [Rhizodiscina lignyota]|uniref:Caffeine-induced death protein 2 n=1 Tax=Rhizodiscina lignyota TaxID=1504668 RepID=A0A9P4I8S6_9PEZI|nr:caffeine-induced death protein 2 [Rhizodiscina lignyota]
MSRPSSLPELTPQFCFNQTALRDFLRISRGTIDDSITQHLNALLTPGTSSRFDPDSTFSRPSLPPSMPRRINPTACDSFKKQVLFPSWQVRSDVLTYCTSVATSPDPEDPDSLLREVESARARERIVNERLDPYSGRYFPREARTESLAGLLRNEQGVEKIIRARTWGLVRERCGNGNGADGWEDEYNRWQRDQEEGKS